MVTKENPSTSVKRKKKANRSNQRSRTEPETGGSEPRTNRYPEKSPPPAEVEKGVEPSRIDIDISEEVRQDFAGLNVDQAPRRVRFDDQPVILQPDPKSGSMSMIFCRTLRTNVQM